MEHGQMRGEPITIGGILRAPKPIEPGQIGWSNLGSDD
jgi:hypothetical protein